MCNCVCVCVYTKNCTVIRYNDKQRVVNLLHVSTFLSYPQGGVNVFFIIEYLPENGRERSKHVGGLPHVITVSNYSNYSAVLGVSVYTWCFGENYCLHLEGRRVLRDVGASYTRKALPLHAKHARRGDKSVAVSILNPSSRRGWVVSATPRPLYPWESDPVLTCYTQGSHQETGHMSSSTWRKNIKKTEQAWNAL